MPESLTGRREGNPGKNERERKLYIKDSPLLDAVYHRDEGVEREAEVERRFLPKRLLSEDECMALSHGHMRGIEQAYVLAHMAGGADRTFRLRRTDHPAEGRLLRVAIKKKIDGGELGKDEYQLKFSEDDPRTEEFNRLWDARVWNAIAKTRYYIPLTLPNGNSVEIHYDVHHGEGMERVVRIEIEFHSKADETLFCSRADDSFLPDWIGKDVTADVQYSGTQIAQKGFPQEARELMAKLEKKEV
ncbi:hypothetical protein HYW60_02690 [Candidatus Kaiserbacteria bacterium]|nr:hypothetical protein [Candidatus Kaiserbacteria bacterium]